MALSKSDQLRILDLAEGRTQPLNGMEKHFLKACRGEAPTITPIETAWLEFWRNHQKASELHVIKNQKTSPARRTSSSLSTLSKQTTQRRPVTITHQQSVLFSELRFAIRKTDRATLSDWVRNITALASSATGRRASGLSSLVKFIWSNAGVEVKSLFSAIRAGNTGKHLEVRVLVAAENTGRAAGAVLDGLSSFSKNSSTNPTDMAAQLLAIALGFQMSSGGLDGNGGVPDLDLAFGIDAHRSILSHSIVSGVIVEVAFLSILDLVTRIYRNLPKEHNPIWDQLQALSAKIGESAAKGTSMGIAYHLGVDGIVQPAPYHDLPVSLPIEGHQVLMTANAAAEFAGGIKRGSSKPKGKANKTGAAFREAMGGAIEYGKAGFNLGKVFFTTLVAEKKSNEKTTSKEKTYNDVLNQVTQSMMKEGKYGKK